MSQRTLTVWVLLVYVAALVTPAFSLAGDSVFGWGAAGLSFIGSGIVLSGDGFVHERGQPTEVGLNTRLNLAQLGVDQLLPAGQRGIGRICVRTQLLAGNRHHQLDRFRRNRRRGRHRRGWGNTTVRHQPGNSRGGHNEENDEHRFHTSHHDEGVSQGSRMPPIRGFAAGFLVFEGFVPACGHETLRLQETLGSF